MSSARWRASSVCRHRGPTPRATDPAGRERAAGPHRRTDRLTGAALFLASDDAAYISGDVIRIDGGMLAQQRSATVDIKPPSEFPKVEDL